MTCMSRDERIANLKIQISVTEQHLEMLKHQLRQLEELTDFNECEEIQSLRSFDDFPKNVNLWRAIMYNATKIMGRTLRDTESVTVEHLIRMYPGAILKYRGVGPGIVKQLAEWMNKHNLSFTSESRLSYAPIDKDELLSTFDHLWDERLMSSTVGIMNAEIERIASSEGKHYYNRYNSCGFLRSEFLIYEAKAGDNYTVGDFLRIDLSRLQRMCRFDDVVIEKMRECMEEHGLEFVNE